MCTYPLWRVTYSLRSRLIILSSHLLSSKHRIPIYPGACTTNDLCSTPRPTLACNHHQYCSFMSFCVTVTSNHFPFSACHPQMLPALVTLSPISSNNQSLVRYTFYGVYLSTLLSHCRFYIPFLNLATAPNLSPFSLYLYQSHVCHLGSILSVHYIKLIFLP